jgi:hypothetical protein
VGLTVTVLFAGKTGAGLQPPERTSIWLMRKRLPQFRHTSTGSRSGSFNVNRIEDSIFRYFRQAAGGKADIGNSSRPGAEIVSKLCFFKKSGLVRQPHKKCLTAVRR